MILLDTHVVVWWLGRPDLLSAAAGREISRADRILVSPVTCWEVALLCERKRLDLDRDALAWVRGLLSMDRVEPAPLTPTAAAAAGLLSREFSGDPVDRLLYATARERGVPFVTRDRRIRAYARSSGDVRAIW